MADWSVASARDLTHVLRNWLLQYSPPTEDVFKSALAEVRRRLEALESAQEQISVLQRQGESAEFTLSATLGMTTFEADGSTADIGTWPAMLAKISELIQSAPANAPWVRREERLPAHLDDVYFFVDGKVYEGDFSAVGGGWWNGPNESWSCNKVSHWMPRFILVPTPEPPHV